MDQALTVALIGAAGSIAAATINTIAAIYNRPPNVGQFAGRPPRPSYVFFITLAVALSITAIVVPFFKTPPPLPVPIPPPIIVSQKFGIGTLDVTIAHPNETIKADFRSSDETKPVIQPIYPELPPGAKMVAAWYNLISIIPDANLFRQIQLDIHDKGNTIDFTLTHMSRAASGAAKIRIYYAYVY